MPARDERLAELQAKHGDVPHLYHSATDGEGGTITVYHPTRESAEDYRSLDHGWRDVRTVQESDGRWANVYHWRFGDWEDGDPQAIEPCERGISRSITT